MAGSGLSGTANRVRAGSRHTAFAVVMETESSPLANRRQAIRLTLLRGISGKVPGCTTGSRRLRDDSADQKTAIQL